MSKHGWPGRIFGESLSSTPRTMPISGGRHHRKADVWMYCEPGCVSFAIEIEDIEAIAERVDVVRVVPERELQSGYGYRSAEGCERSLAVSLRT